MRIDNLGISTMARHYSDVIMGSIASQITSITIVCSIVYSDADQRKHQSSALLAFVRGIHRLPVISPHKWPLTRKMFPFDDVITSDRHCATRSHMGYTANLIYRHLSFDGISVMACAYQ